MVSNRFTGDDAVDGVSVDGSDSDADIVYLTRADFDGTFPRTRSADRAMTENVAALNLYDEDQAAQDARLAAQDAEPGTYQPATSTWSAAWQLFEDGELTDLGRDLGEDYDSPFWEIVLDRISVSDMERLTLHGYLATGAIDAIGKPLTKEVDGPAQVGSFNQLSYGVGYPSPCVLAQTWNKGLARAYGSQLGQEAAALGVDGLYAPCANLYRTPLGGRNYEYYAEDPLVCGTTAAEVVAGAREAGTYCFLKHFAVNNQDSYRDSLYTWLTEQALRELYLRPFQIAVEGGATGLMTSYNRIGATWAGGSRALLTDVLREEWGFTGAVITDYADHQQYMSADQALLAGGDLYMDGVFRNGAYALEPSDAATSRGYVASLRRATKDVLYALVEARATNLAYNEVAVAEGNPVIERPVKTAGPNYLGISLALADAVAFTGAAAWVHRALERRKKPPAGRSDQGLA